MKTSFLALVLVSMAAVTGAAFAQDQMTAKAATPGYSLFWGVGLDVAPALSGFGSSYGAGLGLNANLGLTLDKNWAVLAALDGYQFNTNVSGYAATEVTLTPDLKYTFDVPGVKPYLFVGAGLNDNIANAPSASASTISFAYNGGAGLALGLTAGLDLQVQVEYESVLTANSSFAYLPISAGVEFN